MSVDIVFLNALGLLPPDIVATVRAGIEDGVAALRRHVPVEHIGVSVHDSTFVGEDTGFGGVSYGPQSFALYVDHASESLRLNTRRNAASTVVHELHHCLRQRSCPFRPRDQLCAGSVLVLEGLAVHCEEFLGFGDSILVRGVGSEMVRPLMNKIAPIIDDPDAEWAWIYRQNGLPKYPAMYPMGYYLVEPYLKAHHRNSIEAVDVPWREFWEVFTMANSQNS